MSDDQGSFIDKWTYVPGRIKDLDLKELFNEYKSDEAESDTDNEQEGVERKDISEILNESFCENTSEKDMSNITAPEFKKPAENGTERNRLPTVHEEALPFIPRSNIKSLSNGNENGRACLNAYCASTEKKINASFDLDLSALPLTTPVKTVNNEPYSSSKVLFRTPISRLLPLPLASCPRKNTKNTPLCTPLTSQYFENETEVYQKDETIPPDNDYKFDKIVVNGMDYVIIAKLGKGGSSDVFCCFNTAEQLLVAIKVVSLSDATTAKSYINEVDLLQSLQKCEKIIKMYDYEIQSHRIAMVMEKGGEDLSAILKHLSTKQFQIPQYMLLFYWMEMLHAVKEIHDNGVIHSDLKPANFLKADGGIKLIDFGIASRVSRHSSSVFKSNREGSCNYVSPEALSHQYNDNLNSPNYGKCRYQIHFKSDVWSLGCILYELVYRRAPFHHIKPLMEKLAAIQNPKFKIPYPEAKWASPRIINTIKKCLQYNVKARPSVEELIDEYQQLF